MPAPSGRWQPMHPRSWNSVLPAASARIDSPSTAAARGAVGETMLVSPAFRVDAMSMATLLAHNTRAATTMRLVQAEARSALVALLPSNFADYGEDQDAARSAVATTDRVSRRSVTLDTALDSYVR